MSVVKANFDVAVKSDFLVAAMGLSGFYGKIMQLLLNVCPLLIAIGEAQAALSAFQIASSLAIYSLVLEGDAINIILPLPFSSRLLSKT
jgi:hypothetical protein